MKKSFALVVVISIVFLAALSNCSKKEDKVTNPLVADWNKTDSSGPTIYHFIVNDHNGFMGGTDIGSGFNPAVWGTYTYTSSTITITDTAGTTCTGVPGTYNYSISGNQMVLTAVTDACVVGSPRSEIVGGTWVK